MSFNVRLFGHSGLVRMEVQHAHQFSSDSVFQLAQPYLWSSGVLVSNGTSPVSFMNTNIPSGQTLDGTKVLRIEVPDGQAIRYEVNPPNRSTNASASSPILQGNNQIAFGSGWTFSFIDASGT